jgi:biopolymer transport protein ExbD
MKTYLDPDSTDIRIEIVPLIDVIFCILTFFILAAVGITRPQGINMTLPEAKGGQAQLGDTLIVGIDNLEQLYLNQAPITQRQLKQQLQAYVKAKPQGVIVLNADRSVPYARVLQVLDLLQSVNGSNVALGTTQPPSGAAPDPGLAAPSPGGLQPSPGTPLTPGSLSPLNPNVPGQTPVPTPPPGAAVPTPPSSPTAAPTFPTVPANPGPPTVPTVPSQPNPTSGGTPSPSSN